MLDLSAMQWCWRHWMHTCIKRQLQKSIIRSEMWGWNNLSLKCFQWDIPPLIWLLYRGFMLVYTVSWLIYMVLLFNTPKFLIYLSHISYCLMVIYYLVAFCNLAWAFLKVRCSSLRKKRGNVVPQCTALIPNWSEKRTMTPWSIWTHYLNVTILIGFNLNTYTWAV